jgi:signal transduction histidine kinase
MDELRVLQIEDEEDDAILIANELRRGGYSPRCTRVETVPELRSALAHGHYDLITSDFGMPRFDAPSALSVVQETTSADVPFIIVSGTIPDTAVSHALKAGAHDFVSKNDLKRLVPAVRRELAEARSRRARRVAEARFQTLTRSLDGLVMATAPDLVIEAVHGRGLPGGLHLPDPSTGMHVRDCFPGADRVLVEAACARVLERAARGVIDDELLELTRAVEDGFLHFQLTISPLIADDDEPPGVLLYLRDISEQRRLQGQVVASDRMATIGTLTAGIAHEINNPLSALLSNLHLLGRELARVRTGQPLTSATLEEMAEIHADADAAAAMVLTIAGDLRTFSRQAEEIPRPVSVTRVLDSSLRMARNAIQPRAVTVRDYADVPPVLGVESSLGQVFLNLLVNAAQAIPEGHSDRHQVRVAVCVEGEHVCVSITDTGHGMTEAVKRRIFTPFFTTKPSGVGTGLGLSICQRIVSSFGGDISVESELGRGTTFRVRLPAAPAATATTTTIATHA